MSTTDKPLTIAVLGGDKRELIIARLFRDRGHTVRLWGTRADEELSSLLAPGLAAALDGAEVLVTPMPGVAGDYSLYAPHAPEPILLDEPTLAAVAPGARYFGGRSTEAMHKAGAAKQMIWSDMGPDDYIQVQHAIPTAEAAIALAVNETVETILGSRALVVGYGRIGTILAAGLRGLGAHVTVAARKLEVRARAVAVGHRAIDTDAASLSAAAQDHDIVFVTAPGLLFTREVLGHYRPDQLVIDLVSPPGGLDHEAAREMGLHMTWARGQADSAAEHSARAQYAFMLLHLGEGD
jgi:dipicolinate synthase subunit A